MTLDYIAPGAEASVAILVVPPDLPLPEEIYWGDVVAILPLVAGMGNPGEDGTWCFTGLAPGKYTVIGVVAPDPQDSATDFRSHAVSDVRVVELSEGTDTAVHLSTVPPA